MSDHPLQGAGKLIDAFGYFPSFHDAEILSLKLNRNTTPQLDYPTVSIEFTVHTWEMTAEITKSGHYRLAKHHLVTFQFDGLDQVDLRDFNHQNVLSHLEIQPIDSPDDHAQISISLATSFGLNGGFRAVSGTVKEVVPCDAEGSNRDS